MNIAVNRINKLLPQTQCRECGYQGCLPYAEALAAGEAAVNLCAPGGEEVMLDIAGLLGKAPLAPTNIQEKALAWIDEAACIGCTACIRACPVDAIMGASKQMHTVIRNECTGCGLCVAPCPVDCIHMQPVEVDYLPLLHDSEQCAEPRFAASAHALRRYEWHEIRKRRDADERRALLAEREAATKARLQSRTAQPASPKPAFNPADLIAQAMARAQAQQTQRATSANREAYQAKQLEEAKERATFRRAQRDLRYGTEEEKTAALAYLREYKAAQEAKAAK
ncbi:MULTISPECIES: RnfABCDGE type electron transport complex subunit B [unclassified Neisseria]|uniref:RnfABCDGE type electron transport complex subunit B n=1 Tax=unclassified Neisseria TaxID=2623750 RepID=UPI002665A87C|nr:MULTISPECIES: RnfABCDGE type electron transport complex subunit B [unclassified Neisseria]MDO1510327.1 RnfABCDGE type electron transport complex subunit B [Neisseria sp. MVDL19-042950]MDO1516496.1 RnfABCDGE type electron transport complex subunit B [Neisseria sp. MVDL18-041461]MDO1563711.1 RnfABCDGE type electron transport complex subunit B [Neisseria sp. MVDL20-010259]